MNSATSSKTASAPHSLPGTSALLRSVHPGHVSAVMPGVVVSRTARVIAHYQPPDTSVLVRSGRRGGPRGRNMEPGGWDGGYLRRTWTGAGVVRVHPVGQPFSVWRWLGGADHFKPHFYVNLEEPWTDTRFGFDTQDWILDLVVDGDRRSWRWKDEDELAWAESAGTVTVDQVQRIRQAGETALSWVQQDRGPFGADWDQWLPDPSWTVDFPDALQRESIAPATRITQATVEGETA